MRNSPIEVTKMDTVICISTYNSIYKEGEEYKIKEVDDEYVTVYYNNIDIGKHGTQYKHFPKIKNLSKLLKEYNECEYDDVKKVLDVTLMEMKNLTYFEDVFITKKILRKQKLEQINGCKIG